MTKYLFLILSYPFFSLIGLLVATFHLKNDNIAESLSGQTFIYAFIGFSLLILVPFLLCKSLQLDKEVDCTDKPNFQIICYAIFCVLLLISCIPFFIHGIPIFNSMNRYEFSNLEYVRELRQFDNAITWFLITSLVLRTKTSHRRIGWIILILVAFLYGEKFSPMLRIFLAEVFIILYLKEAFFSRSFMILIGVLGAFVLVAATTYWYTESFGEVLINVARRIGKQSSCIIAVTDRIGFMSDRFGTFWNYFEARSKGVSFFHEISRAVSLKSNHSVLGDSFPCSYMAIGRNIFEVGGLIIVFTALKVLLVKLMFLFLGHAGRNIFLTIIFFLYVRYMDSILASDKFHLLTHPVFLISACIMTLVVFKERERKMAYD